MRTISLFYGAILLFSGFTLHTSTPRCVQFIVLDLTGYEQCAQIDAIIGQKDGVLMTRTDFNTQNYLARLTEDCALTEVNFDEILAEYSLEIQCYIDQPWTQDFRVRHLNAKDCNNPPSEELE